jgi:carbon monoxide dehydrogenase subunit G
MELKARYTFPGPVGRVWDLLMDPKMISSCLPGCDAFEPIGDDRYRVVLNAGVAAVTGTFEGAVQITEKQPPVSYKLAVDGKGRPGFVKAEATITLTEDTAGVTIDVAATAQIGGLIAQVGQRLLGATARMMMDRFFNCLQRQLPQSS